MKKVKLPLEMANGVSVRTLEELKENWDFEKIVAYYADGRLVKWLRDRYCDELAQKIENLHCDDLELQQQLCTIFGVEHQEERCIDVTTVVEVQSRSSLLRQFTSDEKMIENVDLVAFNQEELDALIAKGEKVIYLCGKRFNVSLENKVSKYIGVGSVTVAVEKVEDWGKYSEGDAVVTFENVELTAETPDAMNQLGIIYEDGKGIGKDLSKAVEWYGKSAEEGSLKGQSNLGKCYYWGIGCPKDYDKAFKLFSESAGKGNLRSQSYLADCYRLGRGVEKDEKKAFEWKQKAAMGGDTIAERNLGLYYLDGTGCKADLRMAVEYLERAANKGDFYAQYEMGKCCCNGIGCDKNFTKMLEWYRKAVETDVKEFLHQSFKNWNDKNCNFDWWRKHLLKIIDAITDMYVKKLFCGTTIGAKHFSLGTIETSYVQNVMKYYGNQSGLLQDKVWLLYDDTLLSTSGSKGFAMDLFGIVTSRKERIWFSQCTGIWSSDRLNVYVTCKDGKDREIYSVIFFINFYKGLDSDEQKNRTKNEINQMFQILSAALKD